MAKKQFDKSEKPQRDFIRVNERIRIFEIRVVHDGEQLGVMKTSDALVKARDLGLDLVEISPTSRPPVCSIIDYGKYMFDKQKQKKANNQSQNSNKEKEISFRYVIDGHDLETKANQARKFIEKGHKVKLVVKFKAREKAHKDKGFEALKKMIAYLEDICSVEKEPGFEGHNVTAKLDVKKEEKKKN